MAAAAAEAAAGAVEMSAREQKRKRTQSSNQQQPQPAVTDILAMYVFMEMDVGYVSADIHWIVNKAINADKIFAIRWNETELMRNEPIIVGLYNWTNRRFQR